MLKVSGGTVSFSSEAVLVSADEFNKANSKAEQVQGAIAYLEHLMEHAQKGYERGRSLAWNIRHLVEDVLGTGQEREHRRQIENVLARNQELAEDAKRLAANYADLKADFDDLDYHQQNLLEEIALKARKTSGLTDLIVQNNPTAVD